MTTLPLISSPRPSVSNPRANLSTHAASYRLLYRGALSLPDSHLLLDGITFAACLDSPSKHTRLLQNPLALALESMRGRPSLRFVDTVRLVEIGVGKGYGITKEEGLWLDESGKIEMDIHPHATLTRMYFENIFCLSPFPATPHSMSTPSPISSPTPTSPTGVKVAIGDSDGPETTQMIIFARPLSSTTTPLPSNLTLSEPIQGGQPQSQPLLQLLVARLAPVATHLRLPRPDDPIPRRPPLIFGGTGSASSRDPATGSGKRELKRTDTRELKRSASGLRVREAQGDGGGKRVKLGASSDNVVDGVFRIPVVPTTGPDSGAVGNVRKGKEKAREDGVSIRDCGVGDGNVFGSATKTNGRDKGKEVRKDAEVDMERINKDMIKHVAHAYLARTPCPSSKTQPPRMIDKTHPDFKELFGWVYRGVGFALRSHIKSRPVESGLVNRLVGIHVKMYAGGTGQRDWDEGGPARVR